MDRGDERLAPLVDRIAELERERGRLEAELAESRRWAEIIGMERDQLRAAMAQDTAHHSPAGASEAVRPDTTTTAGGALGRLRRAWQTIRGQ